MRAALINLPWNERGRLGVRAGSRWPFTSFPEENGRLAYVPFPFFLAYAAALLKKENKNVVLIDAIAENISADELIKKIGCLNPELLLFEISTPSFYEDLKAIDNIHANFSNCRLAVCGSHASVFFEKILKEFSCIDFILFGEYEYTLLDLVDCLEKGSGLHAVLGLAYREGDKIRLNSRRPAINDLNALPWPEREDVPLYAYRDAFAGLPVPNVQMWSSRGCPFKCVFCLWPQVIYGERKYRGRNPADVINEMEYLIKRFDFKAVYFDDDVFNADKRHVLGICNEILNRGIKIPWAVMARADIMDEEMLLNMREAGVYAIKYGIESASNKVLNLCGKNMDLNKTKRVINFTKKLGIKAHLTFCLGLPGESRETIEETRGFIREVQPDSLQFSFATPFPGTEYFKLMKEKGWLLSEDWPDYDGNYKCIIRTEDLSSEDLSGIRKELGDSFNI